MTAIGDPRSFDHLAHHRDRIAGMVEGPEMHAYLSFRLPPAGGRAVDLGCGSGVHTALLAERYAEVLAVDVSDPMLRLARARRPSGNVRYVRRDLADVTPGEDGLFDLVFSAYTLHHVADLSAALPQVRSLVRPGGMAVVVDLVDDRRWVPRPWLRREAYRVFRDDLLHRRRPVTEAVDLLRLQLDPDWLDHQSTDRLLPPREWEEAALTVFPRGRFAELYRSRALCWRHDEVLP